jgi:hypothetical protein
MISAAHLDERPGGGLADVAGDPTFDLLQQFVAAAGPKLRSQATPKARLELFWSFAKAARDLASQDVWENEFNALAAETGLTVHRLIREDGIDHVLQWAWRSRNPFR